MCIRDSNYDHQVPAENVKVRLDLSGLVPLRETKDLRRWEVKVLSPDAAQPQFSGLSLHGSVCEFTLDRIEHYTVVTLSARPVSYTHLDVYKRQLRKMLWTKHSPASRVLWQSRYMAKT